MDTTPIWFDAEIPPFPALDRDLIVDVLVVGGGITGLTAAHLLAGSGLRVALVERERLAVRDTGHTTAHFTYMTDTRLSELVEKNGSDRARLAWQGGVAAMEHLRDTSRRLGLDGEIQIVPGYLAARRGSPEDEESTGLSRDATLARDLGFDVTLVESDPVTGRPALLLPGQMKFHPRRYLAGLLTDALAHDLSVYEYSAVTEIAEGVARVNGHRVSHGHLVLATHVPLQGLSGTLGAVLFQTKLALYTTYAISARLPRDLDAEWIWSDTGDPFDYLRIDRGPVGDRVIFGGGDHRTGQEKDTPSRFRDLERRLSEIYPGAVVEHRWSGQVVETADGLPYIGPTADHQFIATGFSGNGTTFGTLAGLMARDAVLGRDNPWSAVFAPSRKAVRAVGDYVRENASFPAALVADRLGVPRAPVDSVPLGEGRLLKLGGRIVAAFRDEAGLPHLLSAVCPHLGCVVKWNAAERTWDCPCHGSRFHPTGEVFAGPAERHLSPYVPSGTDSAELPAPAPESRP